MLKRQTIVAIATALLMLGHAYGSDPGDRIAADDIGLFVAGLKAEPFLPPLDPDECRNPPPKTLRCARGFPASVLDADGNIYFANSGREDEPSEIWRTQPDGEIVLVARLFATRSGPFGSEDRARFAGFYIDLVHGLLYLRLTTECFPLASCDYSVAHEIVRISGLPRLRGNVGPRGKGHGTQD